MVGRQGLLEEVGCGRVSFTFKKKIRCLQQRLTHKLWQIYSRNCNLRHFCRVLLSSSLPPHLRDIKTSSHTTPCFFLIPSFQPSPFAYTADDFHFF